MNPAPTISPRSSTRSSSGGPSSLPRAHQRGLRAADFHEWQTLTTARQLYALPRGSIIANGRPCPLYWTRTPGGNWDECDPHGDVLPRLDEFVPADGLPSRYLALPAVVVRVGDGIVT